MSAHHKTAAWQVARHAARERDSWRCTSCGKAAILEVHHVVAVKDGGTDSLDNLETKCRSCHIAHHRRPKTADEMAWADLVQELL